MRIIFPSIWALGIVCLSLAAQGAPEYRQIPAQEVRVRGGIGHTMAKINAGHEVTVAYLGGSITAMNGWRNKTTEWLKATYPKASFKEVHAAIGGTGSDLGVFRLGRDVLAHRPDLLFVEFATNDGGTQPEQIWRSMEGIVRQTWRQNPQTDIIFTYTITTAFTNDYCRGMCNRSASAMELLADHYAIPSINFGPRVAALINENKLIMDAKMIETAVPKESADRDRLIRERIAADPRLLFANDGVHPRDEGHDLYKASVIEGLTQMKELPPVDHAAKLAVPFVSDHWEAAKMVPVTRAMLSGKCGPSCRRMTASRRRLAVVWARSGSLRSRAVRCISASRAMWRSSMTCSARMVVRWSSRWTDSAGPSRCRVSTAIAPITGSLPSVLCQTTIRRRFTM